MKKLLITLAALVLVCTGAAGQGNLLKGLGQKALNKVENSAQKKVDKKVDQTMDKAVDKALGNLFGKNSESTSNQTAVSNDEEPEEYTFAGSLLYENHDIDNFVEDEDKQEGKTPIYSYQDLVKYRPEWPKGAELANRAALEKYAEKVQDYCLSAAALLTANMSMKAMMALGQDNTVDNSVQSPKAQAIAEELVKINEERNSKVQGQNKAVVDGLRAALGGMTVTNYGAIGAAMADLKAQIIADWPKSPEFKKVNAIEESGKAKLVRAKEQSAVIDSWNKAQLEKWVAALQQWEKDNCGYVTRVVELDEQLEALPEKEKKSAEYKIAKSHANGLQGMLIQWAMIPEEIFKCPYVEYPRTEEDY